ncbi:hypothetical protein K7640_15695 [Micromonospora sp. PLK6-60]|uniref:hypothetical protein n=1 Tax=Micromonospora sp. PLK6-60 TaxID=2873383 RepID=UPI001CA76D3F|nr:hypothetical protein [Micromonospora sp. PLK6-60]MBY8873278.1 hypothetical protein [Micromonospora sp. PLK6-60]
MTSTTRRRFSPTGPLRQDRPRVQTIAYAIGGLLVLSGVVHLVVFLVGDTPWEGPVSWRKPTTFGLSFGLTLITIAWVSSMLVMRPRTRAWLLGVFAADCVLEVAGITIQAWRRVPSHFNYETPFDARITMSLAFGGAVLVLTLGVLAVVALRGRVRGGRDLALAVRAGFLLLLVALGTGVVMIVMGVALVRAGEPQLAYDTAGFLKPLHGTTLHAVLVLPLIAEVTRLLGWPEHRRHQAVAVASGLYLAVAVGALWLSLR